MFDTTVFNRIALHLAEIAAQLKRANELKEREIKLTTQAGPIPVVTTPAPSPQVGWPPSRFGTPYTLSGHVSNNITREANR